MLVQCTLLTSKITESLTRNKKFWGFFLTYPKLSIPLIIQFYFQNCIIKISEAYLCNGSKATSETGNNRSKLIAYY